MTYQEFDHQFKEQVKSMAYSRQHKLAVSVCNMLFSDYKSFSEVNSWGDQNFMLETIKYIEQTGTVAVDKTFSSRKISAIEAITPDTEDFGDASYALNCCIAVCETLEFLSDLNSQHIYIVGTCLTDTIDSKIQENDDLTEQEIDSHPDMIEARKFLLDASR